MSTFSEELERLGELLQKGAITQDEFEARKAELLESSRSAGSASHASGLSEDEWHEFAGETEVVSHSTLEAAVREAKGAAEESPQPAAVSQPSQGTGKGPGFLVGALVLLLAVGFMGLGFMLGGDKGDKGDKGDGETGEGPLQLVQIRPVHVSAGSTKESTEDSQGRFTSYHATNAIDGKTDTWWSEAEKDDGLGVRFTIDVPGWEVHGLRLVPGYDKIWDDRWGDRWGINNRLEAVEVETKDLQGQVVDVQLVSLPDRRLWHQIDLRKPARLSSVVLRVVSIHPSVRAPGRPARWKDTGISEIELIVPEGTHEEQAGSGQ